LNPLQLLRRVWLRKWLLLIVAGIVFAGLAYVIKHIKPLYTATAQIVIEAPPVDRTNPLQASPSQLADREGRERSQVLMSRALPTKRSRIQRPIAEFNRHSILRPRTFGAHGCEARGRRPSPASRAGSTSSSRHPRVIAVSLPPTIPRLRAMSRRVADLYLEGQRQSRLGWSQASDWLSSRSKACASVSPSPKPRRKNFALAPGFVGNNGVQVQAQQLSGSARRGACGTGGSRGTRRGDGVSPAQ
jgi:hypothetical protein